MSLSSHDSMSSGGFGGGGVNYDSPRNVLQQPYYNQQQQQQQYTVRNGSDGAISPRYIRFFLCFMPFILHLTRRLTPKTQRRSALLQQQQHPEQQQFSQQQQHQPDTIPCGCENYDIPRTLNVQVNKGKKY